VCDDLRKMLELDEENQGKIQINQCQETNKLKNSYYNSYYNSESKLKKKISNKSILDNLLINIDSFRENKFQILTENIKIESELYAPRDNRDNMIIYKLSISFKNIKSSKDFIENFKKECEELKSSNISHDLLTYTKNISFEDCEDESFLKFILESLNPYLLNEASRINFTSKNILQQRELLNYTITKLLSLPFSYLNRNIKCNLQTIYISNTKVNVKLLMNLFKYYPIKNIFLVDNSINDEDIKIISFFLNADREKKFMPEGLYLFNNKITDRVFEYLFALVGRIELINLNDNLITDVSLRYICNSEMPEMKIKTSFY